MHILDASCIKLSGVEVVCPRLSGNPEAEVLAGSPRPICLAFSMKSHTTANCKVYSSSLFSAFTRVIGQCWFSQNEVPSLPTSSTSTCSDGMITINYSVYIMNLRLYSNTHSTRKSNYIAAYTGNKIAQADVNLVSGSSRSWQQIASLLRC